jgi:hypothetical protein
VQDELSQAQQQRRTEQIASQGLEAELQNEKLSTSRLHQQLETEHKQARDSAAAAAAAKEIEAIGKSYQNELEKLNVKATEECSHLRDELRSKDAALAQADNELAEARRQIELLKAQVTQPAVQQCNTAQIVQSPSMQSSSMPTQQSTTLSAPSEETMNAMPFVDAAVEATAVSPATQPSMLVSEPMTWTSTSYQETTNPVTAQESTTNAMDASPTGSSDSPSVQPNRYPCTPIAQFEMPPTPSSMSNATLDPFPESMSTVSPLHPPTARFVSGFSRDNLASSSTPSGAKASNPLSKPRRDVKSESHTVKNGAIKKNSTHKYPTSLGTSSANYDTMLPPQSTIPSLNTWPQAGMLTPAASSPIRKDSCVDDDPDEFPSVDSSVEAQPGLSSRSIRRTISKAVDQDAEIVDEYQTFTAKMSASGGAKFGLQHWHDKGVTYYADRDGKELQFEFLNEYELKPQQEGFNVLPLETELDRLDLEIYAQQCFVAKLPELQSEAAALVLPRVDGKKFERRMFGRQKAYRTCLEKREMPTLWEKAKKLLTQTAMFKRTAAAYARGERLMNDESECWPPAFADENLTASIMCGITKAEAAGMADHQHAQRYGRMDTKTYRRLFKKTKRTKIASGDAKNKVSLTEMMDGVDVTEMRPERVQTLPMSRETGEIESLKRKLAVDASAVHRRSGYHGSFDEMDTDIWRDSVPSAMELDNDEYASDDDDDDDRIKHLRRGDDE